MRSTKIEASAMKKRKEMVLILKRSEKQEKKIFKKSAKKTFEDIDLTLINTAAGLAAKVLNYVPPTTQSREADDEDGLFCKSMPLRMRKLQPKPEAVSKEYYKTSVVYD